MLLALSFTNKYDVHGSIHLGNVYVQLEVQLDVHGFVCTVEPQFMNLIRSWRPFVTRNVRKLKLFFPQATYLIIYNKNPQNTTKFKRRHGEFEQGCVMSESYTATDALPLILPACRQLLLPACMFITQDTVHKPRFFFRKICS
jgi:hypothetical protein